MIPKGNNQHVMPAGTGWCVIDEVAQMVVLHFPTLDAALEYANANVCNSEGCVLIHSTPYPYQHAGQLSTVSLPQRTFLYAEGYAEPLNYGRVCSDFDSFLGFDEYYFEI
ncbi:MAG TPA: DUF2188 domain-containing protein [Oculatellaceae cyanobacterium]|jgi:hypothetical protein